MSKLWYEEPIMVPTDHSVELIRERDKEIENIHRNMAELNEIFKELSVLVEKQEADVIKVTEHIQVTEKSIDKGVAELHTVYERRAIRCIIL
jgi:t-SNARE complex subunit (syntaxin)